MVLNSFIVLCLILRDFLARNLEGFPVMLIGDSRICNARTGKVLNSNLVFIDLKTGLPGKGNAGSRSLIGQ
jgi:hypothetical protein